MYQLAVQDSHAPVSSVLCVLVEEWTATTGIPAKTPVFFMRACEFSAQDATGGQSIQSLWKRS